MVSKTSARNLNRHQWLMLLFDDYNDSPTKNGTEWNRAQCDFQCAPFNADFPFFLIV